MSKWVKTGEVHDNRTGEVIYDEVFWDGDDLLFDFYDPADYPEWEPQEIEDANVFHRADWRHKEKFSKVFNFYEYEALAKKRMKALMKIRLSDERRENPGRDSYATHALGFSGGIVIHDHGCTLWYQDRT